MSIRPGWFYHSDEHPHSLERLFQTYLHTVGGNTCFNLNIPPMPSGLFAEEDVARLEELGSQIRKAFSHDLAPLAVSSYEALNDTQAKWNLQFPQEYEFHYITLMEDIAQGQRVESFQLRATNDQGMDNVIYRGTTIGHKKICCLSQPVKAKNLTLLITGARDQAQLRCIQIF